MASNGGRQDAEGARGAPGEAAKVAFGLFALLVFVPPRLYAAAIVTPARELGENLQPISLLAFSLVLAPVTATLVQDFQGDGDATVLWWSLALGADLGGNATAIGASANVVILGLAQRAGQPISFLEFTRYGAVVAVATMLVCVPYLWLPPLRPRLTCSTAAVDAGDGMIRRRHGMHGRGGDPASVTPALYIRKDPWQLQLCRPSPLAG